MAQESAPEALDADRNASETVMTEGDVLLAPQENTAPPVLSSSKVSFGKYEIDITRPLAAFSHSCADAYECVSQETGVADNVAIVIKERYPVREDYVDLMIGNTSFNRLMELRTVQSIVWPDDTHRYVLVFRRPSGQPLFPKHVQRVDPMSDDAVKKSVIRPVLQILRALAHNNLFHGNIRPSSLFLASQENAECTLIECISSIPGINQPMIFESVERSMASPSGRGDGTLADDVYALGATVAVLLRGINPLVGKSDRSILDDKLNFGSYVLMAEGLRLGSGINEFLRGTLNDDARQRWGLEQIGAWLEGNRTTSKLATATQKAQRALEFNGKKYLRPRMLAKDLYENVTEAVALIESGQLLKWVERAISDQNLYNALSEAIYNANTAGRSPGFEDRLLCFVSMALDPAAPIRYKELRVFPSGIGYSLALAYMKGQPISSYTELIRDRYGWYWLNYVDNFAPRHNHLLGLLDQASKLVIRRGIHFGLERAFYLLCPDSPCMSDLFKDHYVINCHTLLSALDDVAERHMDSKQPMDRHIASFIMTHDNHDNAGLLHIYDGPDKTRRSLALLTLFQQLQKRFDNQKLEKFCRWLARDAEAVILRFNDQQLIKNLQKTLPKEIKTGDLTRILALVDNPLQVRNDTNEFTMARRKYAEHSHELDMIRMQLDNNPQFGYETGQQTAMIIALLLSGILIAATLLAHFAK